jgi:hypothetical protein
MVALLALEISSISSPSRSEGLHRSLTVDGSLSISSWQSVGIDDHFAYGLSIFASPMEVLRLGLSGRWANANIGYDFIGSTRSQSLRLSSYQLLLALQFLQLGGGVQLQTAFGAGFAFFSSDGQKIDAGGVGEIEIPARSEQLNLYSIGLIVTKDIGPRVFATLSPKAIFLSPVRISSAGFSIEGGLSIAFF